MADEPENTAAGKSKSKKNIMLGGILAGVMILEGAGLYVAMNFMGSGPDQAGAAEGLVDSAEQGNKPEVTIARLKVPNRTTGTTFIYDVEVAATLVVPEGKILEEYKDEFETKLAGHENAIKDRLSFLIRSSLPQHLDEPGLVMIRRQIKAELGKIMGDEKLFETILLPRWTPMRADM